MPKELVLLALLLGISGVITLKYRKILGRPLVIALLIGIVWSVLAKNEYGYSTNNVTVLGINLYPVLGWTVGLSVGYILFLSAQKVLSPKSWWAELLIFNAIYLPLLIVVETVAYHTFGVVNSATAEFAGLPICNCMHAPLWMQASYLLLGSIYFALLNPPLSEKITGKKLKKLA